MAIATISPVTGETLKTFEPLSKEALEEKLARAATAWQSYRGTSVEDRAGWLRAAADVLDADTDAVAELMTTDGPAVFRAWTPVSVKMPVPMTTPIPKPTRWRALRCRRSRPTPPSAPSPRASASMCSMDLVRKRSTSGT